MVYRPRLQSIRIAAESYFATDLIELGLLFRLVLKAGNSTANRSSAPLAL